MRKPKRAIYFSEQAKVMERRFLKRILAKKSITQAAVCLCVARNTLLNRMDALGMRNGKAK
jgi:transcriptional regulator with PAS, ATPase and Fis domain